MKCLRIDTTGKRSEAFHYLRGGSGCFRLEQLPGGISTNRKAPPCHGEHRVIPSAELCSFGAGRMRPTLHLMTTQARSIAPRLIRVPLSTLHRTPLLAF
jgi:hypothetical protein